VATEREDLAIILKGLFKEIYKGAQKPVILRFNRVREGGRILELEFVHPAKWPEAPYTEINAALLSLHHAGFIVYGANTITLNDTLLLDRAGR
jgi:hypothetical protein